MYIHVHTCLYNVHTCMYMYINLTCCAWQANTRSSTGCVRLDINLLKPARIEFAEQQHPPYPYLMELIPLQSGESTCIGLLILS